MNWDALKINKSYFVETKTNFVFNRWGINAMASSKWEKLGQNKQNYNKLFCLVVSNSCNVSCGGRNCVINTLSAAVGKEDKVRSWSEVTVAFLAMPIEVVTLGIRNFPLILIGSRSYRLKNKIFIKNSVEVENMYIMQQIKWILTLIWHGLWKKEKMPLFSANKIFFTSWAGFQNNQSWSVFTNEKLEGFDFSWKKSNSRCTRR